MIGAIHHILHPNLLASIKEPFIKSRVSFLYYLLVICISAIVSLTPFIIVDGSFLRLSFLGVSLLIFSSLLYFLVNYKLINLTSHLTVIAAIIIFSNYLFIVFQDLNALLMLIMVKVTLFSFFMLGKKWGLIYSLICTCLIFIHALTKHYGLNLFSLKPVVLDSLNYYFILTVLIAIISFIVWHFYKDYQTNLVKLTETLVDQKKLLEEYRILNQKLEINEQRLSRYNKVLVAKNDILKRANEELDHFVYSVSHDLRAPVASLQGLINLAKVSNEKENLPKYLSLKEKTVKDLDSYITNVLDYSLNTRENLDVEGIYVEDIINVILLKNDPENQVLKKVSIRQNTPIYTDKRRIQIILNNIIGNAIKFTKHIEHAEVSIDVKQRNQLLTIIISDNGVGIPSDIQEKVFQMFFRGNENYSGSGLGLYISKQAIEKIKGEVLLKSQEGKGSIFTLTIPSLN